MNQKELANTFMMISNKKLGLHGFYKKSALQGLTLNALYQNHMVAKVIKLIYIDNCLYLFSFIHLQLRLLKLS